MIEIESPNKPLVESLSLQKHGLASVQAGRTSLYGTGVRHDSETSGMRRRSRSSCGCFSAWMTTKHSRSRKLEDKQINIFGTHGIALIPQPSSRFPLPRLHVSRNHLKVTNLPCVFSCDAT